MDETSIQVFDNQDFGRLRVTMDDYSEPWFVAKDVCDALGLDTSHVRRGLDDDEVSTMPNWQGQGVAPLTVSEAGMYSLVLKSRKPEAHAFRRWVTHDVLPTIRRHGVYATPQTVEAMLADPDTMIATLTALKAERERSALISEDNARMLPKAIAYDAEIEADGTMSVTECARYLAQSDRSITRTWLFAHLRADGILCKRGNAPTREAIDRGYAVQMLSTRTNGRANPPYARMTRKGYDWCQAHYTREVIA